MTQAEGWLGPLPVHWALTRLGALGALEKGRGGSKEDNRESGVPVLRYGDLYSKHGIYVDRPTAYVDVEITPGYTSLPEGSVVFAASGESADEIGKAALSRLKAPSVVGGDTVLLHPTSAVHPRFLVYVLDSHPLRAHKTVRSTGFTVVHISAGRLKTLPIPAPPLDEQRAIADYLDDETGQIDTLIGKQERLIETLRERRAAVVEREFFGTDGKRVTYVRRTLAPLNRPAVAGLGVITAYRDGCVTLRSNRRDDGYTFSDTEHGYQEIRPGDLVFHALDGFAGAVGISDSHGIATPVYHVCRAKTGDDLRYVAMLLRYLGTSGFLATQAPNVRQRSVDFRNWGMFARVPLALPDPEQQRSAVRMIDNKTAKIDALIAKAERFIEVSKERRSALITAAVTGQIDLRGRAL